jgi:hypothetical protein
MGRTIVGLDGTTVDAFAAAGTDVLAAAEAAQSDADAALADAAAAQSDADAAVADAAADKPVKIAVAQAAETDSTETVVDGAMVERVLLRITTEYSAGATATPSLYNASGSQALGSAVAIGEEAVGKEIEIPLDILNASGYDGVFRITLGGSPAAGGLDAILYRAAAPVA